MAIGAHMESAIITVKMMSGKMYWICPLCDHYHICMLYDYTATCKKCKVAVKLHPIPDTDCMNAEIKH